MAYINHKKRKLAIEQNDYANQYIKDSVEEVIIKKTNKINQEKPWLLLDVNDYTSP